MFRSLRVVRVILVGIFFFRDIYCTGTGYYESPTNGQGIVQPVPQDAQDQNSDHSSDEKHEIENDLTESQYSPGPQSNRYDRIELLTDGFVTEEYDGHVPVYLRKLVEAYYGSKDTAVISMTAEPALINPKTVENLKSFLNVQTSEEHLADQRDDDVSKVSLLDFLLRGVDPVDLAETPYECSIEKNVFNDERKTTILLTLSNFKTPPVSVDSSNRIAEIILYGTFRINWRVNPPDWNYYTNQYRAMQKFMSNVTETTLGFDGHHVKLEKLSFGPIVLYHLMSVSLEFSLEFGQCDSDGNTHAYVSPTCSDYERSTTTI
eukprot:351252_1